MPPQCGRSWPGLLMPLPISIFTPQLLLSSFVHFCSKSSHSFPEPLWWSSSAGYTFLFVSFSFFFPPLKQENDSPFGESFSFILVCKMMELFFYEAPVPGFVILCNRFTHLSLVAPIIGTAATSPGHMALGVMLLNATPPHAGRASAPTPPPASPAVPEGNSRPAAPGRPPERRSGPPAGCR